MMRLIDMLDVHIDKHRKHTDRFDTGAMVARNFAVALLPKEEEQIKDAWRNGGIEKDGTPDMYYQNQYNNE